MSVDIIQRHEVALREYGEKLKVVRALERQLKAATDEATQACRQLDNIMAEKNGVLQNSQMN